MSGQEKELRAKLDVIELAVVALGTLTMRGPTGYLTFEESNELRQCLQDALEVLNDEKGNN